MVDSGDNKINKVNGAKLLSLDVLMEALGVANCCCDTKLRKIFISY